MANSMIIHGKNQKIGCFYKLTTQISVKNGQNGLPSMGCRAGTSCGPRPFFIRFYTTHPMIVLHRLSNSSSHCNCVLSNSLQQCLDYSAHSLAATPKSRLS